MSQRNIQLTPTPRAFKTHGDSFVVNGSVAGSVDSGVLRDHYVPHGGKNRTGSSKGQFGTQRKNVRTVSGHQGFSAHNDIRVSHGFDRIRDFVTATPQRTRGFLVLAVTFAVTFAIFPPLRDYYIALRTQQDLETYYAELKQVNNELITDIQRLQSTEGIEDEARKRGYVNSGETAVSIKGMTSDTSDNADADSDASVEDSDERPWYTRVLDVLFGYVDTTAQR